MSGQDGAIARFPAGLQQPAGSYRFGLDALLLGALCVRTASVSKIPFTRAAELGCGCGAALLSFALRNSDALCLGLELEQSLVDAANANASLLGLENRVSFAQADLSQKNCLRPFCDWQGKCNLVLANPPWRKTGSGRLPQAAMRQKAFFASENMTERFASAAAMLLMHHGHFCSIIPPGLLATAIEIFAATGLGLRRLLPVVSYAGKPAKRLLLVCSKGACSDPLVEFPLILHENIMPATGKSKTVWTEQASNFCPWLDRHQHELNG